VNIFTVFNLQISAALLLFIASTATISTIATVLCWKQGKGAAKRGAKDDNNNNNSSGSSGKRRRDGAADKQGTGRNSHAADAASEVSDHCRRA
jgi:hypothetical protein